jgi:hypothetical protein
MFQGLAHYIFPFLLRRAIPYLLRTWGADRQTVQTRLGERAAPTVVGRWDDSQLLESLAYRQW